MSSAGGRERPASSWCGRPRGGPGSDLKVALPILARTTQPGCSPVPGGGGVWREWSPRTGKAGRRKEERQRDAGSGDRKGLESTHREKQGHQRREEGKS